MRKRSSGRESSCLGNESQYQELLPALTLDFINPFSVLLLCPASSSSRHYTKTSGRPGIRCRPGRIRLQMVSQKRLLRQDRPGRTSRSAHISINFRGFQGHMKVGFIRLRQASVLTSKLRKGRSERRWSRRCTRFFFSMKSCLSVLGLLRPLSRLQARLWDRQQP